MTAFLQQIVLLLIRHGLTAVGLEKLIHDPDVETKIGAAVAMGVGIAWSTLRKISSAKEPATAKTPAGGGSAALLGLFLAASVVGCASDPTPSGLNRWEQISRAAAYGGSISWLKDHPRDCAKFAAVADEFAVMARQEFVIMSDFLRVARQLPVHELRDNGNVLLVTEFVVVVLDGNGALESEKVQLYLKPIINGAATGLRLGVDRFCNSPAK